MNKVFIHHREEEKVVNGEFRMNIVEYDMNHKVQKEGILSNNTLLINERIDL